MTASAIAFAYLAPRWVRLAMCCAILYARCSNEAEHFLRVKPLPGGYRVRATLYESNLHRETTTVVRTASAWDSLWQRIGAGSRPEIDFEREMLVVVGLDMGGWDRDLSIRIDGRRSDSLIAIIHIRDGIPNLCMLDASRAPMEIVRVARDPRPVAFRQEFEHLRCGH